MFFLFFCSDAHTLLREVCVWKKLSKLTHAIIHGLFRQYMRMMMVDDALFCRNHRDVYRKKSWRPDLRSTAGDFSTPHSFAGGTIREIVGKTAPSTSEGVHERTYAGPSPPDQEGGTPCSLRVVSTQKGLLQDRKGTPHPAVVQIVLSTQNGLLQDRKGTPHLAGCTNRTYCAATKRVLPATSLRSWRPRPKASPPSPLDPVRSSDCHTHNGHMNRRTQVVRGPGLVIDYHISSPPP